MASSPQSASDYVFGQSELEQKRLVQQAAVLRPWTERFFGAAGIRPGMYVLDLGCGMGDVSLLAAEMVGPEGRVVGVDRDPAIIDRARARAEQQGLTTRMSFVHADLNEFRSGDLLDAVVGRYVMLYQ